MIGENLLAYAVQVVLWTAVGALLPRLMRMRDPRTLLPYFQVLLLACVLLPALQPWLHPVVIIDTSVSDTEAPPSRNPSIAVKHPPALSDLILPLLACGVLARFLWLGVGMRRLRRYRTTAAPFESLPEAVTEAFRLTGVQAEVLLSSELPGPVTFGARRPVVLLPSRFLALPHAAQVSVACHELLHVKRRDWIFGVSEELLAALVWFHPAVWWLAARIRLAREQAVDRSVVSLTSEHEHYVDALLVLAREQPRLDYSPAQPLLTRSHIVQRIEALVKGKEEFMSPRRLLSRYSFIAVTLAFTAWLSVLTFPLTGRPQVKDAAGVKVDAGGKLLHRTAVDYPEQARRKGISGSVLVELNLAQDGSVIDGRVVSGPDELRAAALKSALDWHYEAGAPKVQVAIEYKLPEKRVEVVQAQAAAPPQAGAGEQAKETVAVDVQLAPEGLQGPLREKLAAYEGRPDSPELRRNVERDLAELDRHVKVTWRKSAGTVTITPTLPGESPAVLNPLDVSISSIPPTPGVNRLRIGGSVQQAKLAQKVAPSYPPLAKQARIQGTVRLEVLIDKTGRVTNIALVSGHPLLVPSAVEAVKQWTYNTTLLNGEPVEVVTAIDVNYTLLE